MSRSQTKRGKSRRDERLETLMLSERDRQAFFDAVIDPPEPSERLKCALAEHRHRVAAWYGD